MARLEIKDDALVITIEGWHKLLALRHKLEIPIGNVKAVRLRPQIPAFNDPDFRGTYVSGTILAGLNMRGRHGVTFVDVEDPSRAIAIDLEAGALEHVIVELSNMTPEEAEERIHAARYMAS